MTFVVFILKGNFVKTYFLIGYKQKKSEDDSNRRQDSLVKPQKQVELKPSPKESLTKLQKDGDLTTERAVPKKADDTWKSIFSRIIGDVNRKTPLARKPRSTHEKSLSEPKRPTVAVTSDLKRPTVAVTSNSRRSTVAVISDSKRQTVAVTSDSRRSTFAVPSDSNRPVVSPYRRHSRRHTLGRLPQTSTDRGVPVANLLKTSVNKTSEDSIAK